MGIFDSLTGRLGGSSDDRLGEGAMAMVNQLLHRGAGVGGGGGGSSAIIASLLGGARVTADGGVEAPASGGMGGVLESMAANGLGAQVSSWLSDTPNLPVTPQQVHDALGGQQVRALAASSGLSIESVLQQLAQHLPQAAAEQSGTRPG